MKNKSINEVGVLVQVVLLVALLYATIMTLFLSEFRMVLDMVLGLTLLSMAYNNYKIYHHKAAALVYLIVGILCMIIGFV